MPGFLDNLSEAASKLQEMGGKVVDGAKELMENARPQVESGLNAAREKVEELVEKARPQVEQGAENVKNFVENLTDGLGGKDDEKKSEEAPAAKPDTPLDALDQIHKEADEQFEAIRNARSGSDMISSFIAGKSPDATCEEAVKDVGDALDKAKDAVLEHLENAAGEAQEIAGQVTGAMDQLKEHVSNLQPVQEAASDAVEAVKEAVEEAPEALENAAEAAQETAEEASDDFEQVAAFAEDAEEAAKDAREALEDAVTGAEVLSDELE